MKIIQRVLRARCKEKISIFEMVLDFVRKNFFIVFTRVWVFRIFDKKFYPIHDTKAFLKRKRNQNHKSKFFETRSNRSLNKIFLYEFIPISSSEIIQFPIVTVQWCSSSYVRYNYITYFCAHLYLHSQIILIKHSNKLKLQSEIHNLTITYPC